jgi:Domain of unknown function (4846)
MKIARWLLLILLITVVAVVGTFFFKQFYANATLRNLINPTGQTLQTRINTPEGYYRDSTATGFTAFARQLKVLPDKSTLKRYDKLPWHAQHWHAAILSIDTGDKNLQQCADCCIRLHAEYLWNSNRKNNINYQFTSGDELAWKDYAQGLRAKGQGNGVVYNRNGSFDGSYTAFKKYLECVYTYAGTISINRQFKKLQAGDEILPGDVIVTPGSPGHAVMVVDVCQNSKGDKLYLLSQGYTPAVQLHIVNNNQNKSISPWFNIEGPPVYLKGAGFHFKNANIVRLAE